MSTWALGDQLLFFIRVFAVSCASQFGKMWRIATFYFMHWKVTDESRQRRGDFLAAEHLYVIVVV